MNNKEKKELKEKIGRWKIRADDMNSPKTKQFCRFFIYYMCFDAWLTAESGKDLDVDKKKWFKDNDNCLKRNFDIGPRMKGWLTALKNKGSIRDMRPSHNGEASLNQIDNLNELIEVIYQIRCNLFHGSKNPNNPNDASLVYLTGNILEQWVRRASRKCLLNRF